LQGTQSRHTKANLAKEPALCQHTGNTLRCDTDPHCRCQRRKGERTTKVLLQAWQDVVIFGCSSLSAAVSAGQAPLGFWLLSFTFISLLSSGWGRTQQ